MCVYFFLCKLANVASDCVARVLEGIPILMVEDNMFFMNKITISIRKYTVSNMRDTLCVQTNISMKRSLFLSRKKIAH